MVPSGVRSPPTLVPPSLARGLFQARLQRVAEGVVGRDVIPLLAGLLDQRAGDRVRFHLRGVADAEHVPMAVGAGDRIGVAARNDVEDALLDTTRWPSPAASAELTLPSRKSTLSRSISLRAFCTAVPASPLVESSTSSSTLRPRMPPLALICSMRELAADQFVLAERGIGAGQRIVEADLDYRRPPTR